jgi:hypothetical protein
MYNVTFIEIETMFGKETHATITHADGSFTSMTKAHYEELQKQADQPIGGNKKLQKQEVTP